jgi:PhnB protein
MNAPDRKTMLHAELLIGDAAFGLGEWHPTKGPTSPTTRSGTSAPLQIRSSCLDRSVHQAIAAGGEGRLPPTDLFWGDRSARIRDPFGHHSGIAIPPGDAAPAEME